MSHLTEEQRYTIRVMIEQNYSQKIIADTIGKSKSMINRDILQLVVFHKYTKALYFYTSYSKSLMFCFLTY
ncbi:MAG: helix-turn-helix domain-containing protein [Paludibacteraceae bacterium]|nr:helix-turn-helix domain-containing protein [Paludibacteraceae bacterium]